MSIDKETKKHIKEFRQRRIRKMNKNNREKRNLNIQEDLNNNSKKVFLFLLIILTSFVGVNALTLTYDSVSTLPECNNNEFLLFNNGWQCTPFVSGDGDFNLTCSDGQFTSYNGTSNEWVCVDAPTGGELSLPNCLNQQILQSNGTEFLCVDLPTDNDTLRDLNCNDGEITVYDSINGWECGIDNIGTDDQTLQEVTDQGSYTNNAVNFDSSSSDLTKDNINVSNSNSNGLASIRLENDAKSSFQCGVFGSSVSQSIFPNPESDALGCTGEGGDILLFTQGNQSILFGNTPTSDLSDAEFSLEINENGELIFQNKKFIRPINTSSGGSLVFQSSEILPAGGFPYIWVAQDSNNETIVPLWVQNGKNNSFSGVMNSQGLVPKSYVNFMGKPFGDEEQGIDFLINVSNYINYCDYLSDNLSIVDEGCKFFADTTSRLVPLFFTGDLEVHRNAVVHEGLNVFNNFNYVGRNGNDFDIIFTNHGGNSNGNLHIRNDRILEENISYFDVVLNDFEDFSLFPLYSESVSASPLTDWRVISDQADCFDNNCAIANGGTVEKVLTFSGDTTFANGTINGTNNYLSFYFTTENLDVGADTFTVTLSDGLGNSTELYSTSSNLLNQFVNVSFPTFYEGKSNISTRFILDANNNNEKLFIDEIRIQSTPSESVIINQSYEGMSQIWGEDRGLLSCGANVVKEYDILTGQTFFKTIIGCPDGKTEILGDVIQQDVTITSQNVTGDVEALSFTLNSTTINDWSDITLGYVTLTYLNANFYNQTYLDSEFNNYYTKTESDNNYYSKTYLDNEFNNYYTKTESDNNYYSKTYLDNEFNNYYTKTVIDGYSMLEDLSCTNGQIAKYNGTSLAWECESDNVGSGGGSLSEPIELNYVNLTSTQTSGGVYQLAQQQLTGTQARTVGSGTSQTKMSRTFEADSDLNISIISLPMSKSGSPTGNVVIEVFTIDGTGKPSTLLATSNNTIDASTVASSETWYNFTFTNEIEFSATTKYAISVGGVNTDSGNYLILVGLNDGSHYRSLYNGASWTVSSNEQAKYKLYNFDDSTTNFLYVTDKVSATGYVTRTPKDKFISNKILNYMDNLPENYLTSEGKISNDALFNIERTGEGSYLVDSMTFVNRAWLIELSKDYIKKVERIKELENQNLLLENKTDNMLNCFDLETQSEIIECVRGIN